MQDTVQQRLDFIGLGVDVEDRLAPIQDSARRQLDLALQRFAMQASNTPSAARFLYGREHISGEGGGPAAHWQALLEGRIDRGFTEAALRMGQRQARIGVDLRWQAGSQAIIVQAVVSGVIKDGIASMMKPRRGPLGLLGAPDAMVVNDAADALARGVATIVGAAMLDLDLIVAGYVDRLRLDAETRLAAEQAKLAQAVEAAGTMLALAAEGRCDPGLAQNDPALAPLRLGAEKLADRVIGLVEDLDVAGRAAETLAADVLRDGQVLVAKSTAQSEGLRQLAQTADRQVRHAADLARGLDGVARQTRALLRRCSKLRRALAGQAPAAERAGALVERVDALGLAANLAAARLAQGHPGVQAVEVELRALAAGLAQVSAQLRADRAAGDPGLSAFPEQAMAALEDDIGVLKALARDSSGLVAGAAEMQALTAALVSEAAQSEAVVAQLTQSLDAASGLVVLSEAFAEGPDAPVETVPWPTPDETALAAHWHAV